MLMKNPTEHQLTIAALDLVVAPGATVEIADGYCRPRPVHGAQTKIGPVIEMLAPQLVPADDTLLPAWRALTLEFNVAKPPTTAFGYDVLVGMSPAVAALVESGNAEVAPQKGSSKSQPSQKQRDQNAAGITGVKVTP